MKGFTRSNQRLSLCGLNCTLCPMYLGKYCPGCGGGAGNQPCKIARCGIEHNQLQYCSYCEKYPCEQYEAEELYDSFISHRRRHDDLKRILEIGEDAYDKEQQKKEEILLYLLQACNDGRRKSFYCQAVNLLSLHDLQTAMKLIKQAGRDLASNKERAVFAVNCLQKAADHAKMDLKLRKKKK